MTLNTIIMNLVSLVSDVYKIKKKSIKRFGIQENKQEASWH